MLFCIVEKMIEGMKQQKKKYAKHMGEDGQMSLFATGILQERIR